MGETFFLDTATGRRIAYHKTDGQGPGVVFLGGFMSDMEGTKALASGRLGAAPRAGPSCGSTIPATAKAPALSPTAASAIGRRMRAR